MQPGQIISAPFLSTQAEVKKFERRSGYALLEIVLQDGNNTYKALRISEEQLAQIQVHEHDSIAITNNAEDLFFYIEANRIRLAYQFDPHLAISVSQIDPLPHQIEAVYHYVLNSPRVRFLLADDPGAGKTIMAGLILKELEYRRLVQRVLIVAPGHLKYQWQREMKERFGEAFAIVDRGRMETAWGENIWEERDRLITSIDFIKQDEVRSTLRSSRWDLVIVDEAHKMSAYSYSTRNRVKIDKTKRYQVGEILSRQAEHLLFLTATPHRGDDENFRLFLDLLRPGFFAQTGLLKESVENEENPVFLRRLKEDMRTFDGKPIFPPRHVHTVPFRLTGPEIELYNSVTRYVQEYFDKAKENRSITFALMILQRRLTSSTHAIYRSLQRRKERLEEILTIPEKLRQSRADFSRYADLSDDELEDLPDDEREAIERRLEYLTIANNIEDVETEIAELERLIEQARIVRQQEIESKLAGLRDQVLPALNGRKLLIFTEFCDTLDYLTEKLRGWGYYVINIHGQMNMDARIQAEHEFRDQAQILVATEAAGEGINLQVCSLMVNYDIPWNPNRLEQRLGRIHRYGQQYEVHIWNLISRDTREGQILDILFQKLESMRQSLGSDRVFDIIGEMIPGSRLDELIKEAIFSQRRLEEIEQVIQQVDATDMRLAIERVFQTGLATRHIDYSGLLQESLRAEENRLVPEYVSDYFLRAFHRLGGMVEVRARQTGALNPEHQTYPAGKVYSIASVPYDLRRWSEDYDFKTRYGVLFREYHRFTFDKAFARAHPEVEFVAPGHPLLEAVNEEVLRIPTLALPLGRGGEIPTLALPLGRGGEIPTPALPLGKGGEIPTPTLPTERGREIPTPTLPTERGREIPTPALPLGRGGSFGAAVFGDPEGQREGALWFLEGEVTDGTGAPAGKRVFCLYQTLNEIQMVNPAILWDLEPLRWDPTTDEAHLNISPELAGLLDQGATVEDYIITQALLPFRDEVASRRGHEARIKEKYGLRSLDFLIQESNGKILDYQTRQAQGEDMDLPLINEQRNLEALGSRRAELEREIRLEGSLAVSEPHLLGVALVVPLGVATVGAGQAEKPEVPGTREGPETPYQAGQVTEDGDSGIDVDRREAIEGIGMEVALEYERAQGWLPEDVSGENHGFDIRSTRYNEDGSFADIRYIEVKARAQSGAVRISANEWKKARHFGEKYWLYIVTQAGSAKPELNCIQDPVDQFQMEEDIFATGYLVPEDRWVEKLEI